MAEETSSDIEDSIGLYLRVLDIFGTDSFESDLLIEQLLEDDVSHVTDGHEIEHHLDVLVEQGVLNRGDGQYRVRCTPEEDLSTWRERTCSAETIYRLIHQAKRQREGELNGNAVEVFEYKGEAFVSILANEKTTLPDLVTTMTERLGQSSTYEGIVLRSPAAQLGHVQQLTDKLCNEKRIADTDLSYHFEKVASNIRGEHKDDLEYRLYLRAIR
ncbi:hypothetical protein [Halocatena marina]|uniref:DUF2250 domain-containing protein n=1 Tax=Halocatena marina TaxID=2934937 RepID=A0ABD5YV34_9EURY|nr:hypothetical protein [Halocatena marina]